MGMAVQEKVDNEDLSAKTGKGFYDWTPETTDVIRQKMAKAFIEIEKVSEDGGWDFGDGSLHPAVVGVMWCSFRPAPVLVELLDVGSQSLD